MNIIKVIRHFFLRRKAVREIYDDMQNLDEVLLEKRITIFSETITPRLAEIGLTNWDGKYIWSGDFNDDGIKHVIQYHVFKVFGGCFSYGTCYDFVPTVSSGKKLVYHKTIKSVKMIYLKKFNAWEKSDNEFSPVNIDKISTVNEEKFRKGLNDVLDRNIPILKHWFENNETIDQNIANLLEDIKKENNKLLPLHKSFEYILSFLYTKKNQFDLSEKYMEKYFERRQVNEIEKDLLRNNFDDIKKNKTT